ASTDSVSMQNPVTPLSRTSGIPPTADAITGTSQLSASRITPGKPSTFEGMTSTSADFNNGIGSNWYPQKTTLFFNPNANTRDSRFRRSLPSPISQSVPRPVF